MASTRQIKAELEIRHLHEKVDYLLHQFATRLMEVQQIQLDLMRELAQHRDMNVGVPAFDVFVMREVMGLESDEICKELASTANNLWVILYRARMALRACLEKHWFADGGRRPRAA